MNKNSRKSLLAAILAIAMIACAVAVVMPSADVDAATDGPLDFDAAVYGYDSSGETNGFDGSAIQATNAGLGNQINVTYDAESATYTLSGTLNKQDIAYDGEWTGDNQTDSAKAFYSAYVKYTEDSKNWGIVLKADSDVQVCVINADKPDDKVDDEWILYFTDSGDNKATGSYKVYSGESILCTINYDFTLSNNTYTVVSNADELDTALTDKEFIILGADITGVNEVIEVTGNKTIDGAGHTITAVSGTYFTGEFISGASGQIYLMSVVPGASNTVNINNLDLNSANLAFGLNIYGGTVYLDNVTSENSAGAGFVAGGAATVIATDITATNYVWGGVNVDKDAKFTANTIEGIGSVYSENYVAGETIIIEDAPLQMTGSWKAEPDNPECSITDFGGFFADFDTMGAYVDSPKVLKTETNPAIINVLSDYTLTEDFTVIENVTLNVPAGVTLTVAENCSITVATGGAFDVAGTVDGEVDNNGTVTVDGNQNIPALSGDVVVESGSTIIVDTLDVTGLTYNGAAIIVTKDLKYNPTDANAPNVIVTQGIPKQIMANQIYLAEDATYSGKVTVVAAIDPISGYYVNSVEAANGYIADGYDVSIISLEAVDIEDLIGADDVIVTIGSIIGTNSSFVGTIATNSANATINGVTLTGTGATNTDTDLTGKGMTVIGTEGDVEGTYLVTVNGTEINGMIQTETTEETSQLVLNNISAGEAGITFQTGSIILSGDIILNGNNVSDYILESGANAGSIVLGDATITGKGTINIDYLTIDGDVEIGSDVVINVAPYSEFTVDENGYLSGTGTVDVKAEATILVYGEIADTVTVKTPSTGVTVSNVGAFISALQYYDKIVVNGAIEFADNENVEIPSTVTVTGKTINFESGGSMSIADGYTVNFVDTIVNAVGYEITVQKGATIGVNGSDIYCAVDVQSGSTVNATNNVTDITGSSIYLEKVGFGNIVNFSNNYTLGSESTFTVYGTINVADGYTLTIAKGATMDLKSSADLTVAGTLDVKGTLTVSGTADVTGTLNVTGTVSAEAGSEVVIDGTMNMNGTMYGEFVNKGTVNIDGTVSLGMDTPDDATDDKITSIVMYDGATLNIEKATGTINVTSGTAYGYPEKEKADKIVINENGLTLTNVEGLVVSATEAVESETVDEETTVTYTMTFDLSGSITAGTILVDVTNTDTDPDKAYITYGVGDINISQTLSIAAEVTLTNNETIEVSGTVTVAIDGTFTNNGTVNVTGKVDVTREKARNLDLGGKVNATYYQVTGTDSVTRTYTSLADAIVAAATADKKTATAIGEQEIAEGVTVTVPADIVLVLEGTIDVKGTLVFNDFEASVSDNEKNIFADVRLDADPARTYTSLANAIALGATDITLNRTVSLEEDLTIPAGVTVKGVDENINIAIAGETENDVTLTVEGAVQLTGTGVINQNTGAALAKPTEEKSNYEGTLVVSGMGYVYTVDDYTGINNVAGAHYQKLVDTDADESTPEETVYVVSTVAYAAADSANVTVGTTTDGVADIMIVGKASAGDVAFAVHVDEDTGVADKLTITLDDGAELTVSSMTIVPGVKIVGTDGTIAGSVASDVGTVDLNKVTGITIESVAASEEDADEPTPEMLTIAGTNVKGDLTISAGTVTVSDAENIDIEFEMIENDAKNASSSLTVASGATLDVDGTLAVGNGNDANANDKEDVSAEIAGTLDVAGAAGFFGKATVSGTVTDKGVVYFAGESVIDGIVSVEGSEATDASENDDLAYLYIVSGTIAGTIDANEYAEVAIGYYPGDQIEDLTDVTVTGTVNVEGVLYLGNITLGDLGTEAYELGTAVSGEINAVAPEGEDDQVTLAGYVKAYYGTTVTGLGDDVNSTAYNVNGKVYMTVYATEINATTGATAQDIMGIVYGEKFNLTEGGLALDTGLYYQPAVDGTPSTSNSGLYKAANWYQSSNMLPNTILTGAEKVGSVATVYATVETIPVSVTVTVTNGLTLYIDGMPQASDKITLSVGEHTVFIQPQTGYKADNATISFAGQTIVTGTATATITVTADMENAVLVATGAEQTSSDITVNVPDSGTQEPPVVNVTTGDNEMSLTDYLLIVLVILIVIMAIIVALRLMRS